MGEGSWSRGCGFESQHHILDGLFSYKFAVNFSLFEKTENEWKRDRGWPIYKTYLRQKIATFSCFMFLKIWTLQVLGNVYYSQSLKKDRSPNRKEGWMGVTRFGGILPLWQKFTSLWQYFKGLFGIWQNCEPTLRQFVSYGQISIVLNGQILKKQSGHLVTLTRPLDHFCRGKIVHPPARGLTPHKLGSRWLEKNSSVVHVLKRFLEEI